MTGVNEIRETFDFTRLVRDMEALYETILRERKIAGLAGGSIEA